MQKNIFTIEKMSPLRKSLFATKSQVSFRNPKAVWIYMVQLLVSWRLSGICFLLIFRSGSNINPLTGHIEGVYYL